MHTSQPETNAAKTLHNLWWRISTD